MSIASAITAAQQKVAAAYTACNSKGATMPAAGSQNLSNLPATINSISGGGGADVVRASEMQSINVGPGSDGKWWSLTSGLRSMSLLLSSGTYTIIAPSCACVFAVVNSIGSVNDQISFSSDYPSRFLTRDFAETTITGQAGKYLVIRADTGANANPAISPIILYEPLEVYPSWDDEPNAVELIDYDGLVLKSMSASEFLALSDYPSFPNPTGLVHAGWNWPFAKAQEYVQKYRRIEVGRLYYTDTGDTRVHITLRSLKTVILRMNQTAASGVTIDWGDGSSAETSPASTGNITPEHTYENEGNYVIKISVTSGTLALGTTANSTTGTFLGHGVFGQTSVTRKIEIGRGVNKFNAYAFWHSFSLKTISMTPDITAIGASFLSSCYKLRCFIFPNGNTTIPNPSNDTNPFGCERYLFPPSATSIGQQGNTSTSGGRLQCVRGLTLPEITSIPNYGFFDLANVDTVAIPSTITSIGNYGFSDMWSMYNLYCYPTTPPTINSNTFRNIRSVCVIHVPAASLEAYKTATNWSAQASKMVGDL